MRATRPKPAALAALSSAASPALAALMILGLEGCVHAPFGSHFDSAAWSQGFAQQFRDPAMARLELGIFVLGGAATVFDDEVHERFLADPVAGELGDAGMLSLNGLALGLAAGQWFAGDGGRALEVGLETILLTTASTHALKALIGRQRPDGDTFSFPSGHTSAAFSAATLIALSVRDETDSLLGFAAYVPAAYVGVSRIRADRHYVSDVVAGALLGTLLANWVHDAHFGNAEEPGSGIFRDAHVGFEPYLDDERTGVSLRISW